MFQPLRESVLQFVARRAGALAFAGLLAVPFLATQGTDPVAARVGLQPPAGSSSITGEARVIDGDTLAIAGIRVRLEGIDAPETDQTCSRPWVGTWKCGVEASEHMARLVRDRTVTCEARGTDAYGRMLGLCSVAGLDINADMVRNGMAWAFVKYSQRYVELETEAREAKRGVWQGEAKPAWIWRAERWQVAQTEKRETGSPQCLIKGNITRVGNIYHMPWERWYDKTRIETDKGERWFCTESDAVAAGWRPARPR
jgi:endonuclease YncB( thermonuclease family)